MFLLIIFVSYCLKEGSCLKHLITVSGRTPADISGRHYASQTTCYWLGYGISTNLREQQMVEMLGI